MLPRKRAGRSSCCASGPRNLQRGPRVTTGCSCAASTHLNCSPTERRSKKPRRSFSDRSIASASPASRLSFRTGPRILMLRLIDVTASPRRCEKHSVNARNRRMLEAEARIATNEASRYLTEVALAWVHTYPVRYDAITAEVELPGGELVMTA